ncbi:uncharacterized protein PV09_03779 [Verruconis gallopava]|uniref:Protein kinase domain-containing protein n=1 Tax=Verruconis gallopava TaxID=253628 RepID=A0A0D2AE31_9PEZI|nr:uncharacterized protein PV09_03779 [Verruconis gallopava]KIW05243.1 hypothetical protein PV09_03779 [Verruconis gallopava]
MDFLKSVAASAIARGSSLPFSFEDRVDIDSSIWTLHNGTKRDDGAKCSIFSFDINADRSRLPLAKNALRKLRTLRHPGVVKVLDTVENDTHIYIATERIVPLTWHLRRKSMTEETIKWGLYTVAKTLSFINSEASSVHGSVRASSVYTSESGEWKLAGFEILSSLKEDDAVIYTYGNLVPDGGRYSPPEVVKTGWEAIKRHPLTAVDAYDFGILVYESFNGSFMSGDQLSAPKSIPSSIQPSYRRLINANPKSRISVAAFLEQGQRVGGFFETPLISITDGIEHLGLKTEEERETFLSQLDDVAEDFPEDFFKMKILPELLKSVEYGGGGPKVLGVIFKIGAKLSDDEYQQQLAPVIVRLFANQDRALRVCLLDNLHLMIDRLPQKTINNNIFPQMVTGFSDIAPIVREQTVKAVLVVVPKLSDRTINGELLRHLAKTANDEQPGIRTNTTICLGKIARNLGSGSRTKVLTAAFGRALRDPFLHARNAALMALAATSDLYSDEDCATKILPGICPALVDKEKLVRDQANKTFDLYVSRIRRYAASLPETVQPPSGTAATGATPRMGTPASDSSSWAGWAISSFTNKIATASGQMNSFSNTPSNGTSHVTSSEPRASSVPPAATKSANAPRVSSGLNPSTLKSNTSSNPLASPPGQNDDDDFDASWGDTQGEDNGAADAWGSMEDPTADPFAAPPSKPTSKKEPSALFDDKGEPDFSGWLSAQADAKKKAKILPKGLTKSSTAASATRPTLGAKSNSTSAIKKASPAAMKPKVEKKQEEVEEDDDAWGDAW